MIFIHIMYEICKPIQSLKVEVRSQELSRTLSEVAF
jgi:hypothetical protein